MKKFIRAYLVVLVITSSVLTIHTATAQLLRPTIALPQQTLTEAMIVYSYSNNGEQIIRDTKRTSYNKDTQLANTIARTATTTLDGFTGATLSWQKGDGSINHISYDALGRKTRVDYNNVVQQTYAYHMNAGKQSLTISQPNGYQQQIISDNLARERSRWDNLLDDQHIHRGHFSHRLSCQRYNDLGAVSKTTDRIGNVTTLHYDALGRLLDKQTLSGDSQLFLADLHTRYDDVANTITQYSQDLSGDKTAILRKQKNNFNETKKVIITAADNPNALENASVSADTAYNNFGLKISTQRDHTSRTDRYQTSYRYNSLGQRIGLKVNGDNNPLHIESSYDLSGQQNRKILYRSTTRSNTIQRYQLQHDGNQALIQQTLFDQQSGQYITKQLTYDSAGNNTLVSTRNIAGQRQTIRYHYGINLLGKAQLTETDIPAGKQTRSYQIHREYYTDTKQPGYGKLKRIYQSQRGRKCYNEIDYRYTYDGLLATKTYKSANKNTHADKMIHNVYDNQTRQLRMQTNIVGYVTYYTYDQAGRLQTVSMPTWRTDNGTVTRQLNYQYDKFNRLHLIRRTQSNANGLPILIDTVTHNYDSQNRLIMIQHSAANDNSDLPLHDSERLTYWPDGNIKKRTVSDENFASYTEYYDYRAFNHLTHVWHNDTSIRGNGSSYTLDYTYDDNSNLQSKIIKLLLKGHNESTVKNTMESYKHNNFDQITQINGRNVTLYDNNGNMQTDADNNRYVYNTENQLIHYHSADGKYNADFAYYADGSRKYLRYRDKSNKVHRLNFYTLNQQVINEIDEQGNSASYLLAAGQRQARVVTNKATQKSYTTFYGSNEQGSVVSGLQINDTNNRQKIQHRQYDPYGNRLTQQTLPTEPQADEATISYDGFQYSGEYTDPQSCGGLHYLRSRYYNPKQASFMQRDSYLLMNEYAYVNGNPMAYADPNGHRAHPFKALAAWYKQFSSGWQFVANEGLVVVGALAAWGILEGVKYVVSVLEAVETKEETSITATAITQNTGTDDLVPTPSAQDSGAVLGDAKDVPPAEVHRPTSFEKDTTQIASDSTSPPNETPKIPQLSRSSSVSEDTPDEDTSTLGYNPSLAKLSDDQIQNLNKIISLTLLNTGDLDAADFTLIDGTPYVHDSQII